MENILENLVGGIYYSINISIDTDFVVIRKNRIPPYIIACAWAYGNIRKVRFICPRAPVKMPPFSSVLYPLGIVGNKQSEG